MTTFKQAIFKQDTSQKTTTTNGMPTRVSSTSYVLDYFYKVGTARQMSETDQYGMFLKAFDQDNDLAIRILLHSRDIREGMGERNHFKIIAKHLAISNWRLADRVLAKIPELGRWDDLLPMLDTPSSKKVLDLIQQGLKSGDALCAKWMPRESTPNKANKRSAYKIRKHLKLTPKEYRKLLVGLSTTTEQQMCSNDWDKIDYSRVPSQASRIYSRAFKRHDKDRYSKFVSDAAAGVNGAKINAGAIYPYEVLEDFLSKNETVLNRIRSQWLNLPNFIESDKKILPMIDVSGSMGRTVGDSSTTCMNVAVSLGLYIAEKQAGVFKDIYMTFSENPKIMHCSGDVVQKARTIYSSDWGYNTNLEAAIHKLFKIAKKSNLTDEAMPDYLIVFSDMQFDQGVTNKNWGATKYFKKLAKKYGYTVPTIVYWNLAATNTTPAKVDKEGVVLVSGFSPSLVKSVLVDIDNVTPLGVMKTVLYKERYDY